MPIWYLHARNSTWNGIGTRIAMDQFEHICFGAAISVSVVIIIQLVFIFDKCKLFSNGLYYNYLIIAYSVSYFLA